MSTQMPREMSGQMSMSTPSSRSRIAPLGHWRAMRTSASSVGRGPDGSTVPISSLSNTKNPGADATHLPALTHSSLSSTTSYRDPSCCDPSLIEEAA